jgi:cytoskeletal protein RodZ
MNKSVKKMLLFVGILIVVIIIISAVYLLLLQPGGETASTTSPSASASSSVPPSPTQTATAESASPTPTDNGDVKTEETAEGTKYTITTEGSLITFSLVTDSAFEHMRTDGGDTFMDVSEAGEYLSIHFVEGAKATELAPSFLDPLIDYKEFEQSGLNFIPGTEIPGETVTANDGNIQFEAWLVDTDKGVLAVVISYSLRYKDDETAKLYKILGTLTIEQ